MPCTFRQLATARVLPEYTPLRVQAHGAHPHTYTVNETTPQRMANLRQQGLTCQPYLTIRCAQNPDPNLACQRSRSRQAAVFSSLTSMRF